MGTGKSSLQTEMNPDRALFEGKIEGIVATCYANERPLRGLAGLLDWRFGGMISDCIRKGIITGAVGECVYLPVKKRQKSYHLFLVGCGHTPSPGMRKGVPEQALEKLRTNLSSIQLNPIGISQQDFGGEDKEYFNRNFKGVPVWIVQ